MRKFIFNKLYDLANAICLLADRLSPENDEIWRERMWQSHDEKLAEQEAEVEVAEPESLGALLKWPNPEIAYKQGEDSD